MSISDSTGTSTKTKSKAESKSKIKAKSGTKYKLGLIKGGRKPTYTDKDRERVLDLIRSGKTQLDIEADLNNPSWQQVQRWRSGPSGARTPFDVEYKKAIADRAELWSDQRMKETMNLPADCTHEQINRQRLVNGMTMWHNAKFDPDRFGDKPATNVQVGIALCLTEDQRSQLLERRERALALTR